MAQNKTFKFLNFDSSAEIPVPTFNHIAKINEDFAKVDKPKTDRLNKYDSVYDDFCRWSSLPTEYRKPVSVAQFEKNYKIPKGYAFTFKRREDFASRCKRYMWEWIRERFPDFVQNMFTKAIKEGNASAIKFFAELIVSDIEMDKPKPIIQPFMILGVNQEKIDRLFQSDEIKKMKVEDVIPAEE